MAGDIRTTMRGIPGGGRAPALPVGGAIPGGGRAPALRV